MIRKAVVGKILRFEPQLPELALLDSFEACGGKLWPAGDVLVQFLADNPHYTKNSRVLELGSGCGHVGISLAAMGFAKQVTLTDRLIKKSRMTYDMEGLLNEDIVESPILLDILKRNIATNASLLSAPTDVLELEWGPAFASQLQRVTATQHNVVIGSDLTYHSSTAASLFWTVSTLLRDLTAKRDAEDTDTNDEVEDITDDEWWDESNNKSNTGCNNSTNSKVKFLTAHEHRLDISTKETLNVAVNKFHLQHEEVFVSSDKKHSVWMFTLRD